MISSKGKPAMGRGIDEIFGDADEDDFAPVLRSVSGADRPKDYAKIPLEKIDANPDQPRKEFDAEAMQELIDSIRANGVIQPILVEKRPLNRYLIIAGERRYRAALAAGLNEIPAVIKDKVTEQKMMELALIENIQRENLTPIEEALAYKNLMEAHSANQEAVAALVGKNRATVANSLRLLKLPKSIQKAVNDKQISMGHAKVLLSLVNPGDQGLLCKKIIDENLSVRETERLAAQYNSGKKGTSEKPSPNSASEREELKLPSELAEMQYQLMTYLGTKTQIKGSFERGKIEIDYLSAADLERIYDLLLKR